MLDRLKKVWHWHWLVRQRTNDLLLRLLLDLRDAVVHMADLIIGIGLVVYVSTILGRTSWAASRKAWYIVGGLVAWYAVYRCWHLIQPRDISKHYACLRNLYQELPFDCSDIEARITIWVDSWIGADRFFQLTPYFPKTIKNGRGRFLSENIDHFQEALESPGTPIIKGFTPGDTREFLESGIPWLRASTARQDAEIAIVVAIVDSNGDILAILFMDAADASPIVNAISEDMNNIKKPFDKAAVRLQELDDPNWQLQPGGYHDSAAR